MKQRKFRIKLHEAHANSKRSVYSIHKQIEGLGVSYNTVYKYLSEDLTVDRLPPEIEIIATALGLDWRDPAVVGIIEVEEDSDSSGQIKTLLATP